MLPVSGLAQLPPAANSIGTEVPIISKLSYWRLVSPHQELAMAAESTGRGLQRPSVFAFVSALRESVVSPFIARMPNFQDSLTNLCSFGYMSDCMKCHSFAFRASNSVAGRPRHISCVFLEPCLSRAFCVVAYTLRLQLSQVIDVAAAMRGLVRGPRR